MEPGMPDLYTERAGRSAERIASYYTDRAVLAQTVGQRLFERLQWLKLQPRTCLDLGSGPGLMTSAFQTQWPDSDVWSLDLSPAMLQQVECWSYRVCADASRLPLASNSMDVVYANGVLPWLSPEHDFLSECHRVLRPDGVLLFTTLGPDTLQELQQSWLMHHPHHPLAGFIDMHHWGDALQRLVFRDPVVDYETLTVHYPDLRSLLLDVRCAGSYPLPQCPQGLGSPRRYQAVLAHYRQHFAHANRLVATFEVIYGYARKPAAAGGIGIAVEYQGPQ